MMVTMSPMLSLGRGLIAPSLGIRSACWARSHRQALGDLPTSPHLHQYSTTIPLHFASRARRSLLYVPGSSEKMLRKSLESIGADTIVLDLEDSVADHQKGRARESVYHKLAATSTFNEEEGSSTDGAPRSEMAVRINPPSAGDSLAGDDLELLLPLKQLDCIVLPKVESEEDILFVIRRSQQLRPRDAGPLSLVLSIESPASLFRLPSILEMIKGTAGISSASITSLLFASEDFCHTAGIIRTRSRRELLFPRQQMALIAKAYGGLGAIDMVCIDYKDDKYLREECRDGNEIGYDGKQAIHPAQLAAIHDVFSPSDEEILRAVKIKAAYEEAVRGNRGAVGVTIGEQTLMIDAPMLKQADAILAKASAAMKTIPNPKSQ